LEVTKSPQPEYFKNSVWPRTSIDAIRTILDLELTNI